MLRRQACALVLAIMLAFSATTATAAAPTIPGFYGTFTTPSPVTGPLPVLLPGGTLSGATVNPATGTTLTINQNAPQATIDWKSFNIAPGATVLFNQKDTSGKAQRDWAALNRIYDANPSQIFGNLQADGKVYLINRNGILFGPGSQIDVHSLIGSALNITLDNFNKGLLRFTTAADSNQTGALADDVTVANHGTITTFSGGSVSLIGPRVENAGAITAPQGSVNLVGIRTTAASLTEGDLNLLTSFDTGSANVIYHAVATPGPAINFSSGTISADSGRVGMYGDTVQQSGIIRAVSAVKKGGEIYLKAKSRVTTDAGSVTESPVSTSAEKVNQTFAYNGGAIQVGGLPTAATFVTGADGTLAVTEGALQTIEHNGGMAAPSGQVTLLATDRIYMGTGSSITVAGAWVDQPASANTVSSTLNSVELRDFYGQKDGSLKGDKIQTDLLNGSAIGNISGSYGSEEKSALERSTKGGTITLTSGSLGQIIVKDGASLNFSGGGFRYAQGINQTSMVTAGNRVYDISAASPWLRYTLLDTQSKTYSRFGVTEQFSGVYYGGGSSVFASSMGHIAGSDAGTLTLAAGVLKLDGAIHGEVTRGIFQTKITDKASSEYSINVARGLEVPNGGTLLIGTDPKSVPDGLNLLTTDSLVQEIAVRPTTVPLSSTFGAQDQLSGSRSDLSAAILSGAGLSTLGMFTNTALAIESGARISLASGGSFTAKARRIEVGGEVSVVGSRGADVMKAEEYNILFRLQDNITSVPTLPNGEANPRYTPLVSTLSFAPGSLVSARGETIDNSRAGIAVAGGQRNGMLNGGKINIYDGTASGALSGNNLVIAPGATLDVSGGYLIDQSGKVNGGDAGSLELHAMNVSLEGDLRGLALAGKKGGSLTLHAGEIVVGFSGYTLPGNVPPDAEPPDLMKGKLLLSQNRFKESGFTRLNLTAVNDVTFSSGIDLTPSLARLPSPLASSKSSTTTETVPAADVLTSPDYLGQTSIKATAGALIYKDFLPDGTLNVQNPNAVIRVESGASLRTAGGGAISLTAPGVDIAGTLSAPGGSISVTANGTSVMKDLNLLEGGTIFAGGYNKPDGKTTAGSPMSFVPQSAGSVSLTSAGGNVNVNFRSLVDVSGTLPTEQQLRDTGGAPQQLMVAGNPGSLSLSYGNKLILDGTISGKARSGGVIGGTLAVNSNATILDISAADVAHYQASGFDDLTFKSSSKIKLPDGVTIAVGRKLTLDSPIISGNPASETILNAPWLSLKNTSSLEELNPAQTMENGGGRLTLSGKSLDIAGNILIKGFQDVTLESARDITLSDRGYSTTTGWVGNLWTAGNLTLKAQRIYPTSASHFTITANGIVTTQPQGSGPGDPASIYSAGGSLTITAAGGINHQGLLAAPLGSIHLDGMGSRVYLDEGSSISTSGSVPVSYGNFDGNTWSVKGLSGSEIKDVPVTSAPDKVVTLNGREVVVRSGSTIDASGGGSITSSFWQSGLEGSVNPFTLASRYVILLDNSVVLPGRAIHLEALPELGLAAGNYSILPAEFAFVPGALVIQVTGNKLLPGAQTRSAQGYPLVAGYATVTDMAVSSPLYEGYAVRRVADVQKEGSFTTKQFVAGDGGSVTVSALETAVIAGSVKGTPLSGGTGAAVSLSGANVQVKEKVAALDTTFGFSTSFSNYDASLSGTLQLQADSVSGKGLKGLTLGNAGTDTVTIQKGSVLQVPDITLNAKTSITLESGTQLTGTVVAINAATGIFTKESLAEVNADRGLTLNASNIVLNSPLLATTSSLNVTTQNIYFVPDAYQRSTASNAGFYLNKSLWDSFSGYTELTLKSSNDMAFLRDVTLATAGSVTIDAGRLVNQTGLADVTIQAKKLSILNSGVTRSATETLTGQLTLSADTITVSSAPVPKSNEGGVLFDGFSTVNVASGSDLLLQGARSLATAGDLKITASRLAATYLPSSTGAFLTAADFQLTSGGAFSYVSAPGIPGAFGLPGGNLAIRGSSLHVAGLIDMPSGNVTLTADGPAATDGVYLDAGANIRAHGAVVQTADTKTSVATPGGQVALSSHSGSVKVAVGALIDVAAVSGSDAGSVEFAAPAGEVTLAGELRGNPASGRGGSFAINSRDLTGVDGLDGLSSTLKNGGFTEKLNIHSRSDATLTLAAPNTITGREVIVAADGGSIDLSGKIIADGTLPGDAGGRVELYAKTALTLENGAIISATGKNGATGGLVSLNSNASDKVVGNYALQIKSGSVIDVSGGTGGTVAFRAYELANGSDVNIAPLPVGAISGEVRVSVEEAKKYSVNGNVGAFGTPYNTFMTDAAMAGLKSKLFENVSATDQSRYHLQAGIELVSNPGNNLILDTVWDLTSVRPGGEAGILTLRAAGNLDIAGNLVDHPTAMASLHSSTMQPSWGLNLVAGADLNGANPRAVIKGQGNLVLGPINNSGRLAVDGNDSAIGGSLVYTENAPINFASGNSTDIGFGVTAGYMINSTIRYNIGSYGGAIRGETGGDLTISAGAIQTAVGDIDLRVSGDLELKKSLDGDIIPDGSKSIGSIRTTGEYNKGGKTKDLPDAVTLRDARVSDYWTYAGGGSIGLHVGGAVAGWVNDDNNSGDVIPGVTNAWDTAYRAVGTLISSDPNANKYLTANYTSTDATEGIATLAGGNISVRSGKGFISQVGTFGSGNLSLLSGGDVIGRYRSTDGSGSIMALGSLPVFNFGASGATPRGQVLELGASQLKVVALGDLNIGAVLNPNNTRSGVFSSSGWDLTYTYKGQRSGSLNTSISLISLAGSTKITGKSDFYGYKTTDIAKSKSSILPPVTEIITSGDLLIDGQFALAPSPTGDLRLIAGGNITTTSGTDPNLMTIAMVDVPLDTASSSYAYQRIITTNALDTLFARSGSNLLHKDDRRVAEIRSGGDIVNLHLDIDKAVNIEAGRDVTALLFKGQNLAPADVTSIRAGRDIVYGSAITDSVAPSLEDNRLGIKQGGPGALLVEAGRNIDLGSSTGIQSIGGFLNPPLGEVGSSVTVIVGSKRQNLTPTEMSAFFYGVDGMTDPADLALNGVIQAGDVYSQLKNRGEKDAAAAQLEATRTKLIRPLFDGPADNGDGHITMTSSQINSLGSNSDVTVMARGSLDVGKSSIGSSSASQSGSGISTAGGGRINIFTGKDVNVNESRIMSYLGGIISIWVDQGDLNAGRGSRTTISPSPPRKEYNTLTKSFITKFTPPSVGSGIRAVTFDPNTTAGGPLPIPEAGGINIYVPNGKIDAGEAGIVTTSKLTLAATEVLNVKNISGGSGSVGVPIANENSVSLGSLAGNSSMTDSSKMIETASTGGTSKESAKQKLTQAADDFLSKYLDVKVLGFDMETIPASDKDTKEELEKKKKK
jgi:filamentous hemagglutinin family protein